MTEIEVQDYVDEYKEHLEEEKEEGNIAQSTVRQRHYAVDELVAWFDYHDKVLDTDDFYGSTDLLKDFFDQTTLHGSKVACVRAYLEYIQRQLPTRDADRLDDIRERIKYSKLTGSNGKRGRSKKKLLEEKILSDRELAAIQAAANDYESLVIRSMLDTGCRPGELAALIPSDFNFDVPKKGIGATVKIEKTYSQGVGVQDHPKTEDSIRTVNLRSRTANQLKQFIEENDIGEEDLIFEDYRTVYDSIKDVVTFAQVKIGEDGVTKFSPHSLRHNTATRLIREGYSKEKVQQYMGHSSVTITEIYEHFDEDEVIDIYA